MCTQYLNTNVAFFKNITKNNNDITAFSDPFDCLIADCYSNIVSINNFNIVTYINLLESNNKRAENILDKREKLQVRIRLTKCTKNENERLSVDLDEFEIDTSENNDIVNDACVPYLNFTRITHIDTINLDIENPKGSYVIKVIVKTPKDEKYTVQSMHHLKIK